MIFETPKRLSHSNIHRTLGPRSVTRKRDGFWRQITTCVQTEWDYRKEQAGWWCHQTILNNMKVNGKDYPIYYGK